MDIFDKGKQFFSMNNRIQDQAISEEPDQKMQQSAGSHDQHEIGMMNHPHASFITHIIKQPSNEQLSIFNNNSTPLLTKPQQNLQISQKQLREKLVFMFKRDKQKNHQICDYFMKDLGLAEHCDHAKRFIEFIQRNQQDNLQKRHDSGNGVTTKYVNNGNDQTVDSILQKHFTQPQQSYISSPNISILSTKSTFIASIFSRDKVQILLELYSTNNKIINFLNFLLNSLRSFIFTNQKQWILMKDQIQRYLSKYEKNVQKIYELDDQQQKIQNCDISNKGKKLPFSITKVNAKLQKTKQIKRITSQMKKRYSKKFTLQNYKSQTSKVRNKLTQHQQSTCSALRKSCYSIYERFEHIVEQLKDEMLFVLTLIQKAERFDQSKEKYQIKQFLLESRRIGVEGLIYLELVYKNIIEKVQDTRRRIFCEIEQSVINKKSLTSIAGNDIFQHYSNNKDYLPKSNKQRTFLKQVLRMFDKLERTLMLKNNEKNVNITNEVDKNNNTIKRRSLLFSERQVVVEVDGDDDSESVKEINGGQHNSSGSKCNDGDDDGFCVKKAIEQYSLLSQQQEKRRQQNFDKQTKKLTQQLRKQQKINDLNKNQNEQMIEQSQNDKFISSIFGDRKVSQQINRVQCQQKQKQRQRQKRIQNEKIEKINVPLVEKKKRIRKVNYKVDNSYCSNKKKDQKSLMEKKVQSDLKQERKVKKETQHKMIKYNNFHHHHNQRKPLPPIDSEDEPNQSSSSSSLQFLSHVIHYNQFQKQFTSPKKPKQLQQLSKNSAHFSSMKKSHHNNHYEEFQSLSIDIPLCIQYEQGSINMEDFDSVSQQMSSFYNDVIKDDDNKGCDDGESGVK